MPETKRSLIPDSLFSWFPNYQTGQHQLPVNGDFTLPFPEKDDHWGKLDFSKPYICIGGGASAGSSPDRAMHCYSQLVDAVQELGYKVYLTENDLSDSFLQRVAAEKTVGCRPIDHFHPYVWCNRSERAAVHLWQVSCLDPCIPRRHSMYLPRNTFAQEWQPLALTRIRCSSTVQRVS